ncbi:hypothetical protein BC828DRAFT_381354 [Blastocladiella britannica]|nr:hypothetical protein BC828DRAFT_381354 [Blastocladiella britannica]
MLGQDQHQQQQQQPPPSSRTSLRTEILTGAMDSLLLKLNGLGTQLTPYAKSVERGFGQARQFAQEKLGTAEDLTELPHEYLDLEHKIDSIASLLTSLLRSQGAAPSLVPAIPAGVTESVTGFAGQVAGSVRAVAAPVLAQTPLGAPGPAHATPMPASPSAEKLAAAPSHAVARACNAATGVLGQEPLGTVATKLGAASEKVGDAELELKSGVADKFSGPINQLVQERLAHVARARRTVTTTRLSLDSVKSRFKSASPQRAEALQVELEKAEDVFVDAVEEATKLMKAVVESPAILRHIANLVALQLAFHKQCAQILSELAPEVDEMVVTQEALYSSKLA